MAAVFWWPRKSRRPCGTCCSAANEKKAETKAPAVSSPSVTVIEPAKPKVEKSETATRLAVLGDSLAFDLANARSNAPIPKIPIWSFPAMASTRRASCATTITTGTSGLRTLISENAFDIAVVIIGINDRQPIGKNKPLADEWKSEYTARLERFLGQLRVANKPVIWVGLPPMAKSSYSEAMTQISSLQRLAAFSGGAEFVDIYERFVR